MVVRSFERYPNTSTVHRLHCDWENHCHQQNPDHSLNDGHSTKHKYIITCYEEDNIDCTKNNAPDKLIFTSGDVVELCPFGCEMVDSISGKNSDESEFDPLEIGP